MTKPKAKPAAADPADQRYAAPALDKGLDIIELKGCARAQPRLIPRTELSERRGVQARGRRILPVDCHDPDGRRSATLAIELDESVQLALRQKADPSAGDGPTADGAPDSVEVSEQPIAGVHQPSV